MRKHLSLLVILSFETFSPTFFLKEYNDRMFRMFAVLLSTLFLMQQFVGDTGRHSGWNISENSDLNSTVKIKNESENVAVIDGSDGNPLVVLLHLPQQIYKYTVLGRTDYLAAEYQTKIGIHYSTGPPSA